MMPRVVRTAPPYSVVVVSDAGVEGAPERMGSRAIAATATSIAVGCLAEVDGETEFTLGLLAEVRRPEDPAFEGMIETPTRLIVVRSVTGDRLLEMQVATKLSAVAIWTNHPTEPDEVVIGVA